MLYEEDMEFLKGIIMIIIFLCVQVLLLPHTSSYHFSLNTVQNAQEY